ncbi:hypothetical protein [Cetobacterium sp. ZOR0034]|nr:hypothetical protein [Cetobacterium sp. ZOR0034]
MNQNYVVVFRHRNFLRSLFSYEEVEVLVKENGEKYRSEIDCIGDIRI